MSIRQTIDPSRRTQARRQSPNLDPVLSLHQITTNQVICPGVLANDAGQITQELCSTNHPGRLHAIVSCTVNVSAFDQAFIELFYLLD
jgi:hypothetical protein